MKQTLPQSLRLGLAAAALIVTGASAQAQESNVSFIDVSENVLTGGFSLADVQAFTSLTGTGLNFALDTEQGSSTTPAGYGTVPTAAIDGITTGVYDGGPTSDLWHEPEADTGKLNTYRVALDTPQTVGSIRLFGRTGCCEDRDNDIQVTLRNANGDVLFTQATAIPDGADRQVLVSVPEPSAFVLGALGTAGLAFLRRRRAV